MSDMFIIFLRNLNRYGTCCRLSSILETIIFKKHLVFLSYHDNKQFPRGNLNSGILRYK